MAICQMSRSNNSSRDSLVSNEMRGKSTSKPANQSHPHSLILSRPKMILKTPFSKTATHRSRLIDSYFQLSRRLSIHRADSSEVDDAYCRFVAALSEEHWDEWVSRHEIRPGFDLQAHTAIYPPQSSFIGMDRATLWDFSIVPYALLEATHAARANQRGWVRNTSGSHTTKYWRSWPITSNTMNIGNRYATIRDPGRWAVGI